MTHFVVINDWSNDYESGITILGVVHTRQEASQIFNKNVVEERIYASNHGYEVFTDCDTDFDAGEKGYYARGHVRLYVETVMDRSQKGMGAI